jgi:2-polyprenyl-6-hydroxyphenyl methylase / 3-demethylubiquinone-9 3-methyltransferase
MKDQATKNANPAEIDRFNAMAHRWWEPDGDMRMLHRMNPARLGFITSATSLRDKQVLDVGCGAGILTEALAKQAARVVGIDLAADTLAVARLHAIESGVQNTDYRALSVESLAAECPCSFDVVTCMEMLEHIPDPGQAVRACAALLQPEGHVFFSTIDRTPKAYLTAVLGAEYLFGILPKGTHRFEQFIRPSELAAWARSAGLELVNMRGLNYRVLDDAFEAGEHNGVNYIAHFRRKRLPL